MLKKQILIVEDNVIVGYDLADMARDFGYSPLGPAFNFEEAKAFILTENIAGVILDYDLEEGTSMSIAEELSEDDIPFVFMSALPTLPEDVQDMGVEILRKPLVPNIVASVLERMTSERREGRSSYSSGSQDTSMQA